jgi:hypothetical protein
VYPGINRGVYDSGFNGLGSLGATFEETKTLQQSLSVINSEHSATDQGVWDKIWTKLQPAGKIPGTDIPFTGWGWTREEIFKGLRATQGPIARGEAIASSSYLYLTRMSGNLRAMLDHYKKEAGVEKAAEVSAAEKWMREEAAKRATYEDPAVVRQKAYAEEVLRRATQAAKFAAEKAGKALDIGAVLVPAALGLGLLIFMTRK